MEFAPTVREADRTAYLSLLFAPEAVRPSLAALSAYQVELARIAREVRDPMAAEVRLQWWRDAIRNVGYGKDSGVALVQALREAMARYAWPADALCAMSEAHIHELYADPFPDWEAFDGHAGETDGAATQLAVMALATHEYGADEGVVLARTAAPASGYAGVMLVAADAALREPVRAAAGRTFLPDDAWRALGTDWREAAGSGTLPNSDEAVRALAHRGLEAHRELRACLPEVPRAVRSAFVRAIATARVLKRLARRPDRPERAATAWSRPFAVWRAARRLRR